MRKKLEQWFARLTIFVYHRKILTVGIVLLLTALLSAQITKLRFDTRDESFFHADDPTLVAYNAFRDTFGQDDIFIIAMRPETGMDLDFFTVLQELHEKLESDVPYLDDIQSLVNGRIVRAEADTLFVEKLIGKKPTTKRDVNHILDLIDRYPLYENLIISEDRSTACIILKAKAVIEDNRDILTGFDPETDQFADGNPIYLSNAQNVEMVQEIRTIIAEYEDRGIDFYLSGTPVFVTDIQKAIEKDLGLMVPLSILIIVFFLAVLFRRVSGVVFPLLTVFLSLFACLGIMACMDIPITNVIQILPTFLIVVGIADSVHILTRFYRELRASGDKQSAVVRAVSFSGLPVLMTSVTTACGLLSFVWADVASVAQLGKVAPIGVLLAFIYTIFLLPALIAIFPIRQKAAKATVGHFADGVFAVIARCTCRYPWQVALIFGIFMCAAVYYAVSVKLSHNAMTWFPESAPVRIATEYVNDVNGGSIMLEVTVDSGRPNGIYEPKLVSRLDKSASFISQMRINDIQAGKVWSIADVIKEINRALHNDKDEAYRIPDHRQTIAQELILFESSGSDDLEDFADSTFQTARLSILAPFGDSVLYKDYVDAVRAYLSNLYPDLHVGLTGHISLFVQITKHFITSMIKSYSIALLVITGLMVIMLGRIRIGLMSMAANVIPILCIFGLMGALNIPLDMSTILIGSIVLGLVVDDTIHFLHHFRTSFEKTNDVETAVFETLSATGRALIITSLVLAGGFYIYSASYLESNVRFGLLSGTSVLFALAADFFMVPALLKIAYSKRPTRS